MSKTAAKYEDGLREDLRDPEEAVCYLNTALEEGSQDVFLMVLRDVADASPKTIRRYNGRALVGPF